MASISEKLVTVAENTPKVHYAGQLNVVQSAQSLKGSESNTAILLDDVSPVTHKMGIRVKSKNLIPFPYRDLKLGTSTYNGVDFTVYEDGSILINGTTTSNITRYLYNNTTDLLGLKSGITISVNKNVSDNTQQANVYFVCNYYDSAAKMQTGIQASTVASGTKTITDDWKGLGIYLHIPSGKTLNNLLIKPQLEIGSTLTAYTPYVPDLTAVKVSKYGKNLTNSLTDIKAGQNSYTISRDNGIVTLGSKNVITYSSMAELCSKRLPAGTYTFSFDCTIENTKKCTKPNYVHLYVDNKFVSNTIYNMNKDGTYHRSFNFKITKRSSVLIRFYFNVDTITEASDTIITKAMFSNVQLELGSTATEYEPYITPTEYTPTADGTVEGVTSLYPNTTLMTNTDGIIIDCDYYKDIDKAFNELTTSVALSGGE